MKIPVEWLKEFVETNVSPAEIGDELTMLGLELEAAEESSLGPVLDFKVTPNRGDCLSVFGLARELAAKDSQRYRPTEHFRRAAAGFSAAPPSDSAPPPNDSAPPLNDPTAPLNDTAAPPNDPAAAPNDPAAAPNDPAAAPNDPAPALTDSPLVTVEAPELCGRYVGAVIRGVKVGTSPQKIAARLQACGMRPIDSVVDTTNYVMLELGQPLHAFDLRQLKGGRIVVRRATEGETMKTLDGQQRALTPEMLMICDAEQPVAIAGVMGGENSEVAADTTELLLESAHFDPVSIRRTRKALGMSTEASYRFERFVDPELCAVAARRVCELLGSDLSDWSDVYPGKAQRAAIAVREDGWNALLGMEVPKAAAAATLVALGCIVNEVEDGLSIVPPSWRNDLQIEEDLVEEIGRMWGYEKIPEALPFGSPMGGYGPEAAFRKRLKAAMLRLGFSDTLTHTLGAASPLSTSEAVEVRNPAAPELSGLRASLLPGMAEVVVKNRGRSLALFEIGRVFLPVERRSLGMIWSGSLSPAHWDGGRPAPVDFFALKGVLESLGGIVGRELTFAHSNDARFQAGRRAEVMAGESRIGVMGEVSPAISESLDLPAETFAAEIDIDALAGTPEARVLYRRLSPYPAVRRDFAFVIGTEVEFAAIERVVRDASDGLAEELRLFDVYAGKGIEPGKHSLGIAVTLRHQERTLTDEEANAFSERAFAEIKRLGGEPRA